MWWTEVGACRRQRPCPEDQQWLGVWKWAYTKNWNYRRPFMSAVRVSLAGLLPSCSQFLPHSISMKIWMNYETHIFKKWGYVLPTPPRLCQCWLVEFIYKIRRIQFWWNDENWPSQLASFCHVFSVTCQILLQLLVPWYGFSMNTACLRGLIHWVTFTWAWHFTMLCCRVITGQITDGKSCPFQCRGVPKI